MKDKAVLVFTVCSLFFVTLTVAAQQPANTDYPNKPVRLIEPFGAGGGVDVMSRPVARKLSELWGQPVTVENHPGAGASAGPALVVRSERDGYTLLVNSSAQAYGTVFAKNLPYDPLRDFIPIAPLTTQSYVLVAGPSSGVTSVEELIAAAKAKPAQMKFAFAGIGTGSHLAVEKFNQAAGIRSIAVPPGPNDGIAEVIAHIIRGDAAYMIAPIPLSLAHIREGRLRALGVTGMRRSPLLPEVPTISEAGVSGFNFPIWYGVWAPAGTPAGVVDKVAAGIERALEAPDLLKWFSENGAEPLHMTPDEFARFVRSESESAAQIMNTAIPVDPTPVAQIINSLNKTGFSEARVGVRTKSVPKEENPFAPPQDEIPRLSLFYSAGFTLTGIEGCNLFLRNSDARLIQRSKLVYDKNPGERVRVELYVPLNRLSVKKGRVPYRHTSDPRKSQLLGTWRAEFKDNRDREDIILTTFLPGSAEKQTVWEADTLTFTFDTKEASEQFNDGFRQAIKLCQRDWPLPDRVTIR